MKKILRKSCVNISLKALLILIFWGCISINSNAQTYVSGGIYTNTTWTTASSPYIVTGNITLFTGANLTIQPGVLVKFGRGFSIAVGTSSIIAQGTPTDSITFTSDSSSPYQGIYSGIDLSGVASSAIFTYCNFFYANNGINSYATTEVVKHCAFKSNYSGITLSSSINIDSCYFSENRYGIWAPNSDTIGNCTFIHNSFGLLTVSFCLVQNCQISSNNFGVSNYWGEYSNFKNCQILSNISYGILTAGEDTIENCQINNNGIGFVDSLNSYHPAFVYYNSISNNNIGIEYYNDSLFCNSICNNTVYNIVNENSFSTNRFITNNYWCTSDSTMISNSIYDGYDNPSLGLLLFYPFDLTPCNPGCNLTVTTSATHTIVCSGSTVVLTAHVSDGNPVYTAVWNPGSYTGLSYTVTPTSDITYTVVVTDSSGCTASASITIDTACVPPPSCNLSVTASATHTLVCSGSSNALTATIVDTVSISTVIWNPGGFSGNPYNIITSSADITYTVTVTDRDGCSSSATVTVDTACAPAPCGGAFPPSICYVSTDTTSTYNTVVWQKVGMDTLAIDSVVIYRQNILDNYVPIGEVSVHAPTIYNDHTARPLVEPYFYALGLIDTCGGDTSLSNVNETVFLQSSVAIGGTTVANLSWNFYQGNPVVYYRILRDDSGTGNWHAIDSVQGTINAYSDRNAPSCPGLRYMISIDWNVVCMPTFSAFRPGHYLFNSSESYSNMTYLYPTGIMNLFNNNSVNVYPDPVSNLLSFSFSQFFQGSIRITDVLGQQVYSNNSFTVEKGNTSQLNLSGFRSGVYFVTFQSGHSIVRKKIVKI